MEEAAPAEPGFGVLDAGRSGELAAVAEGLGGEALQAAPSAGVFAAGAPVAGDGPLVPAGGAVGVPVDVVELGSDLRGELAAGEVGDVVAGAESFEGEGARLARARAVHADHHGELVGEAVGGAGEDDRAPGVQERCGALGDVRDGEGVAAAVVLLAFDAAVGADHQAVGVEGGREDAGSGTDLGEGLAGT